LCGRFAVRCGGHDELVTSGGVSPVDCFGDTVGRGGIDLEVRELLTFSMLVALGGTDAQVRGHVNGNLRVGIPARGCSPCSAQADAYRDLSSSLTHDDG